MKHLHLRHDMMGKGELARLHADMLKRRRDHVLRVLAECGDCRMEAARRMGMHRRTLQRWLTAWGVKPLPWTPPYQGK